MPDSSLPKQILVIPLRYIGDTVLSVPLIRNLKRCYPQAQIDVLCSKTAAPLLEHCPYIRSVIIEPKGSLALWQFLKTAQYDQVYSLRKSVSLALLCKLAGAPKVIGYDKQRFPFGYKRWGLFLDAKARYPSLNTEVPQAISHLSFLDAAGLESVDDYLELWATEADQQTVNGILSEHRINPDRPMAVLHAASASHGKQIDLSKFNESLQKLHQAGYQLITTGTQHDHPLYQTLAKATGLPIHNLAGKTSLRETVALYQRIQLLLTVDSSPIHLGAATNVPKIVGVFGPTNHKQWGAHNAQAQFKPVFQDLPCRPCYAKVCEHNNCKTLLSAIQIAQAVGELI